MCGLYGAAGALGYRDKEMMKTLAILSTLRGEDSAGCVVVPRKGGDPITMKTVGTSFDMFNLVAFDKVSLYEKGMFIGHTRKATIGGITKAAAHPFSYEGDAGHVHGTHNGTLTRWTDLPCGREVSDSATAFRSIAEIGLRATVERLGGAYAFVYYDQHENTLNFLRNNQRTLFYAMSEDFKCVYWASESWMLYIATSKHDVKLANLDTNSAHPVTVLPFETDTWFRVKIAEAGTKDIITFLPEETIVADVIKPEVKKYGHPFRAHGWDTVVEEPDEKKKEVLLIPAQPDTTPTAGASRSTPSPTGTPTSQTSTSGASRSQRPTLTLVAGSSESGSKPSDESEKLKELNDQLPASLRIVKDIDGNPLTREAFEELTDSKCTFCLETVTYEDICEHAAGAVHIPGISLWADRERFVCTTCVPSNR